MSWQRSSPKRRNDETTNRRNDESTNRRLSSAVLTDALMCFLSWRLLAPAGPSVMTANEFSVSSDRVTAIGSFVPQGEQRRAHC
jgi:hypothetical protein